MSEIKIDKTIPVPERRNAFIQKYPWDDLRVGDSFFVTGKKSATGFMAPKRLLKNGYRITVRPWTETVDGRPVKGYRIWRIQ